MKDVYHYIKVYPLLECQGHTGPLKIQAPAESFLLPAINMIISTFGKRIFARFCSRFADQYNNVSHAMKVDLFKDLNEMKKGEKMKRKTSLMINKKMTPLSGLN